MYDKKLRVVVLAPSVETVGMQMEWPTITSAAREGSVQHGVPVCEQRGGAGVVWGGGGHGGGAGGGVV